MGVLFLICVMCALPWAAAQCTVPFTLNPQLSNFTLASSVVEPVKSVNAMLYPDALTGLLGSLEAVLPGQCPSDVAALVKQLKGSKFTSTPELGPLKVFPSEITVTGLANVTLSNWALNLSTGTLDPDSGGAPGPQFQSKADAVIAEGENLSVSMLSPTPETIQVVGLAASSPTQVFAAVVDGLARVELRGLNLTFTSTYFSQFLGNPIKGVAYYSLLGSIVMEAAVGCAADCGPNGKCWPSSGSGAPACACECGWAGAACEVPSGFCPRFSTESFVGTCPVAPSSPPPSPEASPQPCVPAECGPTERFNSSTGRCECVPGWGGATCQSCASDAACKAYHSDASATCSAAYEFTPHSQFKAYTCNLDGTGLDDVIESNSFFFRCNTTEPSIISSPAGQYCEVNFALKNKANNPINCKAYQCSFRANSTRVDCANTECMCQSECKDVQGILDSAHGKPVIVDCDPSSGKCTIEIQDFFVTFVAPCTPAECLVDSYSMIEGSFRVTPSTSYDPVIAAVPLMALLLVAAFLSFYLISHRAYFSIMKAGGTLVGAAVAEPAWAGKAVHELRFDNLSCTIPLRRSRLFGGAQHAAHPEKPSVLHAEVEMDSTKDNHSSAYGVASAAAAAAAAAGAGAPARAEHAQHGSPQQLGSSRGAGGMRRVLSGVSGVARVGELVGVLGPSGSGKTTLLSLVTSSTEDLGAGAKISGAVLLDREPLGSEPRREVALVPQDDTLLSTLTVAECIAYSALLRLPASLSPEEVQGQVWRVIEELGLQSVAGSRVGGNSGRRGISGGERRRVTIGMELVTDPAILVLDEPTSGLDSFTALLLMKTLKQVASSGRIVLLTIHQPSPAMLSLLDRAYLLAQGSCLFCGPPAAAEEHFASHGLPVPQGAALAEHMLEVVSDPSQLSRFQASLQAARKLQQLNRCSSSGEAHSTAVTADALSSNSELLPPTEDLGNGGRSNGGLASGWKLEGAAGMAAEGGVAGVGTGQRRAPAGSAATNVSRELAVVFWRTLVDIVRNPSLLLLHWVVAVAMGVLMGAIFFNVGLDISGAQNRAGGLFFALAFFAFTSLTTTDLLTAERKLVVREVRGGYYRPWSYLLTKAVLDALLLRVLPAFLYAAPFYPMMGLQSGSTNVALFLMLLATFAVAVGALSLAVTVGFATAGKASLVMNLVLLISLLVGGFFVNVDSIPDWIGWLHYVSVFFYAYASLMINEVATLSMDFVLEGYAAVSNVRGLAFLDIIGIDPDKLTTYVIVLDCLYAGFLLLAFVLLYARMPRPKRLQQHGAN